MGNDARHGKIYHTDTARCLGSYSNDLGISDFRNLAESLYRTPRGNYFLAGEGGAMSKYCRAVGDMWAVGEGIIPLTEAEAREWAEHRLDADEYEEAFGACAEA